MMREKRRVGLALAISLVLASGGLSAEVRTVADVMGADVRAKLYESSAAEAEKKLDYLKAKAALERYEGGGPVSMLTEAEKEALLKAERERIANQTGIPLSELERGAPTGGNGSLFPSMSVESVSKKGGAVALVDSRMEVIEVFRRNGQTVARLNTLTGPVEVPVGGEIDGWKVVKATINGVTLKESSTGTVREIY